MITSGRVKTLCSMPSKRSSTTVGCIWEDDDDDEDEEDEEGEEDEKNEEDEGMIAVPKWNDKLLVSFEEAASGAVSKDIVVVE